MGQQLGVFVGVEKKYSKSIRDNVKPSDNIYVELESQITECELLDLIARHEDSNYDANEESLNPFIEFLAARFKRVAGTSADYQTAPDSFANQLCVHLAHAIARKIYHKTKASGGEAESFYAGEYPEGLSVEERETKLRDACASNISTLFTGNDSDNAKSLIRLMTKNLDKKDWVTFIACCELDFFKKTFLGAGYVNDPDKVHAAVTDLARQPAFYGTNNDENIAKLFCLVCIYKEQRKLEPEYKGPGGWWTGFSATTRARHADALLGYLTSDSTDFDAYMKDKPKDAKTIFSVGHMAKLATQVRKVKSFVPEDLNQRVSAMAGS